VFHIDPKTKRTWITASTKAISVSFFYDSSRNLYRIISVEGTKVSFLLWLWHIDKNWFFPFLFVLLRRLSILQLHRIWHSHKRRKSSGSGAMFVPTQFMVRNSKLKFIWINYVNFILGLGFASEAELGKFIEKFHEVKEATKNAMAKSSTNGSQSQTPVTSANASPVTSRSSITQNDSFGDIAEPPLSTTGSIVSSQIKFDWVKKVFSCLSNFVLEVGESSAHIRRKQ
jgi:homer